MKFYFSITLLLALVVCNFNIELISSLRVEINTHKNSYNNEDKQSVHLSPSKLLISDSKLDPVIINNKEGSEEYSYSDTTSARKNSDPNSNFDNKLKQAEKDLIAKLKKDVEVEKEKEKEKDRDKKKHISDNRENEITSSNISGQESNKNSTIINSSSNSNTNNIPVYKIIKIDTKLKISSQKTFADVNERIKFELANGSFSSIIRKISLAGSSDSLIAFKLSSSDLKLKEARIINNCFEESLPKDTTSSNSDKKIINIPSEPYLCVIAIFDEVNAKDNKTVVEIEYEYVAQNILRIKEAALNGKSENNNYNSLVWYYDNYKRSQPFENVNFEIIFENNLKVKNFNKTEIIAYPDKMKRSVNNTEDEESINQTATTIFAWKINMIKENEFQKISLDLPVFNDKCRKLVKLYFKYFSK